MRVLKFKKLDEYNDLLIAFARVFYSIAGYFIQQEGILFNRRVFYSIAGYFIQ